MSNKYLFKIGKLKITWLHFAITITFAFTIYFTINAFFITNTSINNVNSTTIDHIGDNATIPINQSNTVNFNLNKFLFYLFLAITLILSFFVYRKREKNEIF
jgi:hypothetical protein